jgi:hypothetical protein
MKIKKVTNPTNPLPIKIMIGKIKGISSKLKKLIMDQQKIPGRIQRYPRMVIFFASSVSALSLFFSRIILRISSLVATTISKAY